MAQQQEVVIVAKKYGAWWRFKTTFKWSFYVGFPLVFWWKIGAFSTIESWFSP